MKSIMKLAERDAGHAALTRSAANNKSTISSLWEWEEKSWFDWLQLAAQENEWMEWLCFGCSCFWWVMAAASGRGSAKRKRTTTQSKGMEWFHFSRRQRNLMVELVFSLCGWVMGWWASQWLRPKKRTKTNNSTNNGAERQRQEWTNNQSTWMNLVKWIYGMNSWNKWMDWLMCLWMVHQRASRGGKPINSTPALFSRPSEMKSWNGIEWKRLKKYYNNKIPQRGNLAPFNSINSLNLNSWRWMNSNGELLTFISI